MIRRFATGGASGCCSQPRPGRLALGQLDAGRRDLDGALALWATTGAEREREQAMREYADALARWAT